jgi:3-oxoacyl-[acyl-carrier protein] reductase
LENPWIGIRVHSPHLCPMKNAIITGSSRGLGKAIAMRLAQEGYHVHLSARSGDELKALAEQINSSDNGKASFEVVDYSNLDQVTAYASRMAGTLASIDVLVNNVGIYQLDDAINGLEHLDQQMTVNFRSPVALTQGLIHRFMEQGRGHIFNVASVVNREPRASAASYSMAKAAFFAYHKVIHQQLKPKGIKVTAFLPASINTSSWKGIDAPKEQFIQPEDIAELLVTTLNMKAGSVVAEVDLAALHPDY